MFLIKRFRNTRQYKISRLGNSFNDIHSNISAKKEKDGSIEDTSSEKRSCAGCIRSSPVASMIGLITILLGVGAFGGGFVLTRKYLVEIIVINFPFLEYIPYAVVGVVVVYALLTYILAALSSGYNRKRFFEGSKKTKFGRCCTIFSILCDGLMAFIWIIFSCIISFYFLSSLVVHCRLKDKTVLDLSYYGINNVTISNNQLNGSYDLVFSLAVVLGGSLIIVFGHIQMLCCASMNYIHLCEERYYENNSYTNQKSEQVLSAF